MDSTNGRSQSCGRARREFLSGAGAGFTGVAMAAMLQKNGFFEKEALAEEDAATAPEGLVHLVDRPGYSDLRARMASYELAFQLQTTAPEALDLARYARRHAGHLGR